MARRIARVIVGIVLLVVSLAWFIYALGIALGQSTFANAVGWAVPFVLLLISIYLVLSGAGTGPLRFKRSLAVCGLIILAGGAFVWVYFVTLGSVSPQNPAAWSMVIYLLTASIGIGTPMIVVPYVAYFAKRGKNT